MILKLLFVQRFRTKSLTYLKNQKFSLFYLVFVLYVIHLRICSMDNDRTSERQKIGSYVKLEKTEWENIGHILSKQGFAFI